MDLTLTFTSGKVLGDGNDDVGAFRMRGHYDEASGECSWIKTYIGAHDVYYRGFREGKGIWGTWDIGVLGHGGFHIWPRSAGEGETESTAEETELPADAVATEAVETATSRTIGRFGVSIYE
jgi:hypothetical protein